MAISLSLIGSMKMNKNNVKNNGIKKLGSNICQMNHI